MSKRDKAGESFKPIGFVEEEKFLKEFCYNCIWANECSTLIKALNLAKNHPQYPDDWVHDEDGIPQCKSFIYNGKVN